MGVPTYLSNYLHKLRYYSYLTEFHVQGEI